MGEEQLTTELKNDMREYLIYLLADQEGCRLTAEWTDENGELHKYTT